MYEIRELSLKREKAQIEAFLAASSLRLEADLTYYAGVFDDDEMVAGGGYAGTTIKCVAVAEEYKGQAITNMLVSHLYTLLRENGAKNVFLFTKPQNIKLFSSLGFNLVGECALSALLETDKNGVSSWLSSLNAKHCQNTGAIVINANPFSLGHLYLVETAAKACSHLHIFVVEEDKSDFPFNIRIRLVKAAVAHLSNVSVHAGGRYIISSAAFPSYFLKQPSDGLKASVELDAAIFAGKIAPYLGIKVRFVGTEPIDKVTSAYNEALALILPQKGVELKIIERKTLSGEVISASRVRGLLAEGKLEEACKLAAAPTAEFLRSNEAKGIIEKIALKAKNNG